jgi:dihydropyrimidinase
MNFEKVIKGGTIYNGDSTFKADIGIEGGKITALGQDLQGQEVFDVTGKKVFPGAIDAHVHFQLPFGGTISADDFENGTKAGACGGVTTIIDFAIQKKGEHLMQTVESRRAEADSKVCTDYSLHVATTEWNEQVARQFREVVDYGIPTFKMFMIYKAQGWMADDAILYQGLELAAEVGAQIGVHAESVDLLDLLIERYKNHPDRAKLGAMAHALSRPAVTEWEAVQRAITWSEVTGGRLYIVHSSAGRTAELVHAARERGVNVYAETCPQYLLLDDSVFAGDKGHLYGTCPQIKKKEDSEKLWKGLANGSVQILATDTCTFTTEQKSLWKGDFWSIPFGMPGVETLVPLTYTAGVAGGRFSINHWVKLVSENPAKLFGMYPRKGIIAPGADADILVWDDERSVTLTPSVLQTNCDWSPFEGFETKGYAHLTFSRGELVAKEGKFVGKVGHGEFVKRSPGPGIE